MTDRLRAEFEVLDERFSAVGGDEWVQRLHSGSRWTEGPAYFAACHYLVFSDIPNDRMLRWDETTGAVGVFRAPSGFANGHTVDRQGRLLSCEHGNRRVTRTEHDGSVTVVADCYEGHRLNSPNDLIEHSDGTIWFTDPSYGIDSDYEGHQAESELDGCHVFRVDPATGEISIVADDFDRPNGLAFNATETGIYIVDTRARHIRYFDIDDAGALTDGRVFADCTAGSFDGIRLDNAGRLWAAAHDGLHCFDPDGTLIGKLKLPEIVSNLTFGGAQRNTLFITATSSLYSIRVKFRAA
jgi:gluconolactonase